ncbi:beta and beta-prime subunits of DNA dependent RNA-polymerase [Piromyces finnis]|uniref:DNA-directed RNA polymerase n=1 Tax=Piromyces finnis TaxID=1754191 RepID=A0A1Y1UU82_9FUNG|nr:beta and beta-prime subunits of DNA dependent RNA-polymerase [Piromyces finnis]|eukprot:ORX41584.1 beta and beta-prime subunits of DNA dependent RNA-polymerase [Piromyces finnis]
MYLEFDLYSNEQIEKLSILISKKYELTDNTTSYILDPQLPCKQCKKVIECPGHLGRIPIYQYIVHPLFVNILCKELTHGKSNKNSENKSQSEYAFLFGNQWFTVVRMYELIHTFDFSENPELKNKMLKVFLKNIPVLPINMRPSIMDSNNIMIHNNITSMYIRLLDLNYQFKSNTNLISYGGYGLKVFNLYKKILGIHSSTDTTENSDKNFIKQILSGKTGIFRSMCLAKRQNFCLRSVIVPNINIPLDKILIPKEFTDQLIPHGYKPNDYVIINRQPTLQTTSILSVRSFPSSSRTIQINPLIASVFQADFDGDEMNIFWLPGEESKKELATKLNISNNIRSFKDGSLMIKFIQDTLTGLYNMTKDHSIVEPHIIENICKRLKISKKEWNIFCKYYKSRMNTDKIPYKHLLSLLIPKSLTLKMGDKYLVDHDCIPDPSIENEFTSILEKIPDTLSAIQLPNLDSSIISQDKDSKEIKKIRKYYLENYPLLESLSKSISNNLTNIVNSGSKGKIDNVIQILMSVGVQAVLQSCYIKSSYSEGLTAKELFIHSKSGRAGIISTSLNTSSTGYMQRELVKSMEDLITDKDGFVRDYNNDEIYYYPFSTNVQDIDDSFLEYAFSMSLKN